MAEQTWTVTMHQMNTTDELYINQTDIIGTYGEDVTPLTNVSVDQSLESITNSSFGGCESWLGIQHVVLHIAGLALTAGFLIPHTYNNHVLISRGSLALGSFLVFLWAAVVICHTDVLVWYLLITAANTVYCLLWMFKNRPVSLPKELEDMYNKLFKPLQITRLEFKDFLAVCKVRDLPEGAVYAVEGATQVGERLSILLAGRLKVTCENLFLHSIEPNQFVDAVEYDGIMKTSMEEEYTDYFQVTIRAVDDSKLCVCETEALRGFLHETPHFTPVLSSLLGKDITHKLYQVQEMLMSHPQYTNILANRNTAINLRSNIDNVPATPTYRKQQNGNGGLQIHSRVGSIGSFNGSRNNSLSPGPIQLLTSDSTCQMPLLASYSSGRAPLVTSQYLDSFSCISMESQL